LTAYTLFVKVVSFLEV